jgi:hypothetical protein
VVSYSSGVEGSKLGTATVLSRREIDFLLKKPCDDSLGDLAELR